MARKNKSQKKARKPRRQRPQVQREKVVMTWMLELTSWFANECDRPVPASERVALAEAFRWFGAGGRPRPADWSAVMRTLAEFSITCDEDIDDAIGIAFREAVRQAAREQRLLTARDAFAVRDLAEKMAASLVAGQEVEVVRLALSICTRGDSFDDALESARLILHGHRA